MKRKTSLATTICCMPSGILKGLKFWYQLFSRWLHALHVNGKWSQISRRSQINHLDGYMMSLQILSTWGGNFMHSHCRQIHMKAPQWNGLQIYSWLSCDSVKLLTLVVININAIFNQSIYIISTVNEQFITCHFFLPAIIFFFL